MNTAAKVAERLQIIRDMMEKDARFHAHKPASIRLTLIREEIDRLILDVERSLVLGTDLG